MLAAVALKNWLAEQGIPGRVRYYGCPAEEGGAAKAFMVRAGAFNDADIAISWHPYSFWEVAPALSLANTTGLNVSKRRMHGPASSVATLHQTFALKQDGGILDRPGVVDYCTGNVAPGVINPNPRATVVVRA